MQKFKMLVGNKERKFNDLIKPFTKLETFIDAKSVLKSIAKPHKSVIKYYNIGIKLIIIR